MPAMGKREHFFRRIVRRLWIWLGGEGAEVEKQAQSTPPAAVVKPPAVAGGPVRISPHPKSAGQPAGSASPVNITPKTYSVQEGDTLFSIADQTNVSVQAIIQLNRLSSQKIYVGQVLHLPAHATPPEQTQNRIKAPTKSSIRASTDTRPRVQGQLELDLDGVPTTSNKQPSPTTLPAKPAAPKPKITPFPTQKSKPESAPQTTPLPKPPPPIESRHTPPSHKRASPLSLPAKPHLIKKGQPNFSPAPDMPAPISAPPERPPAPPKVASKPPQPTTQNREPRQPTPLPPPKISTPKQKPRPAPKMFPPQAIQGTYVADHVLGNRQAGIDLSEFIQQSCINAVVLDIKNERGYLSYPSQVPTAAGSGANRRVITDPGQMVARFKEAGLYTIARIVAFKDTVLATTHPHLAAQNRHTGLPWKDVEHHYWVNPFAEEIWAYLLALTREVAGLGFDEILFDSLRFPSVGLAGSPSFSRTASSFSMEDRVNVLGAFLSAARGLLAGSETKLAANLVGYACWRQDDSLVGHHLERLAPYLDTVCPLLDPVAFPFGVPSQPGQPAAVYPLIKSSTYQAVKRLQAVDLACQIRPWLPDTSSSLPADLAQLQDQITGAIDGKAAGFLAWNPDSVYTEAAYSTKG